MEVGAEEDVGELVEEDVLGQHAGIMTSLPLQAKAPGTDASDGQQATAGRGKAKGKKTGRGEAKRGMGDEEASGGAAVKRPKRSFHDTDKPGEASASGSAEDGGEAQRHCSKLDLELLAKGDVNRAGQAIDSARRCAERLRNQGSVGSALLLEEHIAVAAAAHEIGKQDAAMPKDQFDLAADMLVAAKVLLPKKTCLLALRAFGRLSGPGSEKAADSVLEAFWPEPASDAPQAEFRHRAPRLIDVPEMTAESRSKCFTELFVGVIFAQLLEACAGNEGAPETASAQLRTRQICEGFLEKFIASGACAVAAECLQQFSPAPRLTASHVADSKN